MEDKANDGLEFKAAEPADLRDEQITLYPQALDNQWVPAQILNAMSERGHRRVDHVTEINRMARHEYVSTLLSGNRVVVNRAFFANSAVVTQDYSDSLSRDALCKLLSTGVIVPYLYSETSPVVRPDFDHNREAAKVWAEQILSNAKPTLLRMSWDDAENDNKIRYNLSRGFARLLAGVSDLNWAAAHDALDLPTDGATRTAFRRRRQELAKFAIDSQGEDELGRDTYVSRNSIYRHFICREESDISQGVYDFRKPFAPQIKQLVDLAYGVGVPDNVYGQLVTPANTINRSALQELSSRGNSFVNPQQIADLLSAIAVNEILSALSGEVELFDFSALQLPDVISGRSTEEWASYNRSLQKVAAANYLDAEGPQVFNALLRKTSAAYRRMLLALRRSAVDRAAGIVAPLLSEAGHLAVSIAAHVSGMEWWELKLDPSAEHQLKHTAVEQLAKLGTGEKQVCLSLAFWNQRYRSLGRAEVIKIDFCSKKMMVARDTFADFFAEARDKAAKLTGKDLKVEDDLEISPSTGVASREADQD